MLMRENATVTKDEKAHIVILWKLFPTVVSFSAEDVCIDGVVRDKLS